MNSSVTVDLGSTSSDLDLRPYWSDATRDFSRRLWLPKETDYANLHLNSLNISSNSTLQNSWFSSIMRPPTHPSSMRIFLWSILSLSANCRDGEQQNTDNKEEETINHNKCEKEKMASGGHRKQKKQKKNNELHRTLCIKVYPNGNQKRLLKCWFG